MARNLICLLVAGLVTGTAVSQNLSLTQVASRGLEAFKQLIHDKKLDFGYAGNFQQMQLTAPKPGDPGAYYVWITGIPNENGDTQIADLFFDTDGKLVSFSQQQYQYPAHSTNWKLAGTWGDPVGIAERLFAFLDQRGLEPRLDLTALHTNLVYLALTRSQELADARFVEASLVSNPKLPPYKASFPDILRNEYGAIVNFSWDEDLLKVPFTLLLDYGDISAFPKAVSLGSPQVVDASSGGGGDTGSGPTSCSALGSPSCSITCASPQVATCVPGSQPMHGIPGRPADCFCH